VSAAPAQTSARYTRSGRARPTGRGTELTIWYLMRLSGVALFVLVLSHYLILHVLYDPAEQHASWIAEVRWSSTFWRIYDWLMLSLVLFHAFVGMRVVTADYLRGRVRTIVLATLNVLAIALFLMGTQVVLALPNVVPGA
jgi:succinate dehydrogenase / fumarate reductase, membrane anchor subunit